jgi:hypothetical protein
MKGVFPMTNLLILLAVLFFIARQLRPKRVKLLTFLILPTLAFYQAWETAPASLSTTQGVELLLTILLALAIGFWQAKVTRVFHHEGVVYTQAGASYLLAWFMLIGGRLLIRVLFEGHAGFGDWNQSQWLFWASLGIAWTVRAGVLFLQHPEVGAALTQPRPRHRLR